MDVLMEIMSIINSAGYIKVALVTQNPIRLNRIR